jgi:hypothetical protein
MFESSRRSQTKPDSTYLCDEVAGSVSFGQQEHSFGQIALRNQLPEFTLNESRVECSEPLRVCRRPFRLSHAAMAASSICA